MSTHLKIVVLILALICSILTAQEVEDIKQLTTGPQTPSFEKDVNVRLQLIDVSVLKDGKYVKNLGKDDFVIKVDGEVVPVKTFDAYGFGQSSNIEDMASGTIPEAASPTRKIVLFFDKAYSSFQGIRRAKSAAVEFVKRSLSPGDEVMVISFDRNFKIHASFTSDRDEITNAIESMPLSMLGATGRTQLFPSENEHMVRNYLKDLRDLSIYLDAWRGRKTFIMFSEGYAQPIALMQLTVYLSDMLEEFSNSNLTIFSIDVAGLGRGRAYSPRLTSLRRDTLGSFATETGGKFYQGNNNIEKMLLNIDEDISNYYVLGVAVPDDRDGGYRDVEIEVRGRDVDLRYSPGFYAPEPFEDMSTTKRIVHLAEGFNLPTPIREFPAQFQAGVFPRNDGSAVANVVMQAPVRSQGRQEFEVRGIVLNSDGDLIDGFHKLYTFESLAESFYHEQYLNLEPGENLVKLVIRDNTTGDRCFKFLRARMPLLDDNLRLSSVMFAQSEAESSKLYSSKKADSRSFDEEFDIDVTEPANPLSIVSASTFLAADNLAQRVDNQEAVFKLSGVADRKQPDLKVSFSVRDEAGNKYDVPVVNKSVRSVPGTGEAIVTVTLNFQDIDPDDYVLIATVEDLDQGKVVGQRTSIRVAQP